MLLQAFIGAIAVTALVLAVGVAERKRAGEELDSAQCRPADPHAQRTLNLSKIEGGKLELRPTVLAVGDLFADLAEVFQPLAQRKAIVLDIRDTAHLPKVRVDRDKLYEVRANLLENAIKFTASGGRVAVSAEIVDDRHITMKVTDTGCGIPPEHLHKVFDKFYRVHSGPEKVAGSGLGLAIAKGLWSYMVAASVSRARRHKAPVLLHAALDHVAKKRCIPQYSEVPTLDFRPRFSHPLRSGVLREDNPTWGAWMLDPRVPALRAR